jgi:hypothetical protein
MTGDAAAFGRRCAARAIQKDKKIQQLALPAGQRSASTALLARARASRAFFIG